MVSQLEEHTGKLLTIKHTSSVQVAQEFDSVSHHLDKVEFMQSALDCDLRWERSFRAVWGSLVVAAKLGPKAGDRLRSV